MKTKVLAFFSFLMIVNATMAYINLNFNVTHFLKQRTKRTLTFEGSGDIRFVIGPIFDVDFDDPIKWRSMVVLYNLHGGLYNLPTEPLYPWDKYENIFERKFRDQNINEKLEFENTEAEENWADDSRLFVYTVLERFMEKQRKVNGRNCLLRSICENVQIQQHVGIMAEILNVVLTPGHEKIDKIYIEAYAAGKAGVDCFNLYNNCPMGSNIFDIYLEYL